MLKISIKKDADKVSNIIFKGHADFDDYGKDIVCAAASSMLITTANAIARYNKDAIDVKYGENVTELIIKLHDEIIDMLINNMLDLLTELETKYKNNIKIIL